MRQKPRPRRAAKATVIELNRSKKLEGKTGNYDGRTVRSRFVRLPEVVEERQP